MAHITNLVEAQVNNAHASQIVAKVLESMETHSEALRNCGLSEMSTKINDYVTALRTADAMADRTFRYLVSTNKEKAT